MATYYSAFANQRDAAPMIYLREPMPGSYAEASVLPGNTMMHMNSGSYSDALAGNPHQQNNCWEASDSASQHQEVVENDFGGWRDGRNEMLVMHPMGGSASILHNGQNLQARGLSLSLGTHIPFGMQMPSVPYRNPDSGFASFLNPNRETLNCSSPCEQSRNAEYTPHGLSGANQDSNKEDIYAYGMSSMLRIIPNSKYLKATRQLLDEVVNVPKALKQADREKRYKQYYHQIELFYKNQDFIKFRIPEPATADVTFHK